MNTKLKINQQITKEIEKLAQTNEITLKAAAEELYDQFAKDGLLYSMGQVRAYLDALANKEKKAQPQQVA